MGFLTDDLVKKAPFEFDEAEKQKGGLFYDALREELCFHYDHNLLYKRFCENNLRNWDKS